MTPTLEKIVGEIHAVNHGWKVAQRRYGPATTLAVSLRNLKTRLQRRLVRLYPEAVRVLRAPDDPSGRLLAIDLREPVKGWTDAAHIPRDALPAEMVGLGGAGSLSFKADTDGGAGDEQR